MTFLITQAIYLIMLLSVISAEPVWWGSKTPVSGSASTSSGAGNPVTRQSEIQPSTSETTSERGGPDYSAEIVDLPPSSVFHDTKIVTGRARRDLPGFHMVLTSKGAQKLQNVGFGIFFGNPKLQQQIDKIFPPGFSMRLDHTYTMGVQLQVSDIKISELLMPTKEELVFEDQRIKIKLEGIKLNSTFKVGPTVQSRENAYINFNPVVTSDDIGIDCELVPFIDTTGKLQVKFYSFKILNLKSVNINTGVYNYLWKKITGGIDIASNVIERIFAGSSKRFEALAGSLISQTGVKFSHDIVQTVIDNLVQQAPGEYQALLRMILQSYKLEGPKIRVHPNYLSFATDVKLNFDQAPLDNEEKTERMLKGPAPYKVRLPIDRHEKMDYDRYVKSGKSTFQQMQSKLKKTLTK